jgi:hypothetical protein
VLDTLADKEPKLSPKATAQKGGTDGPALHPTQEDLKAYAYGRLASARLDYCQAHLDTCEDCRIELEDIRTCSNEMSSQARPDVPSAKVLRRKRNLALPVMGSAAILVAVAVATALWVRHDAARTDKARPVMAVTAAPVAQSASAPSRVAQGPVAQQVVVKSAAARNDIAPSPAPQGTFARIAAALSQVAHNPCASNVAPTRVAQAPGAGTAAPSPPAAGEHPGGPQLTDEIAALPDDVRSAVSATLQHGKLEFPTNVGRSRRHTPSNPGAPSANTSFALLGPFGEATSDTRPEFSWQPLPGAVRYSVAIVDAALHPVQHSGVLKKTVWRPKRPLHPGRTYLWQVTATLPGGSRVVASEPAPSEAVLRIVPVKLTDEMARFRKDHQDSHLVLGALYAQAGMLTESEAELKKVPPSDTSYKTARTLLDSLSSTGASPQ